MNECANSIYISFKLIKQSTYEQRSERQKLIKKAYALDSIKVCTKKSFNYQIQVRLWPQQQHGLTIIVSTQKNIPIPIQRKIISRSYYHFLTKIEHIFPLNSQIHFLSSKDQMIISPSSFYSINIQNADAESFKKASNVLDIKTIADKDFNYDGVLDFKIVYDLKPQYQDYILRGKIQKWFNTFMQHPEKYATRLNPFWRLYKITEMWTQDLELREILRKKVQTIMKQKYGQNFEILFDQWQKALQQHFNYNVPNSVWIQFEASRTQDTTYLNLNHK